ncbi:MAG TPA: hypothetical protein VKE88_03765 [Candidatus Nanoarchaeia archaeon]|nr:hypothetical protein [Candidatus Nanoarchaeia archaeon]
MTTTIENPIYTTYACRDKQQAREFVNGLKIVLSPVILKNGGSYKNHVELDQTRVRVREGSVQAEHLERMLYHLQKEYGPIKQK